MNRASLASARHPLWTAAGWLLIAGTIGASIYYIGRGPRIVAPQASVFPGTPKGLRGTITEQLDNGRFVLAYETIEGQESDLHLKGVHGTLDEPETHWTLDSPAAERQEGHWTLSAPLDVGVHGEQDRALGQGRVDGTGPALRWQKGAWEGLAPLRWQNLEGTGKGRWTLPKGWRRTADGRLTVEKGPVLWEAAGQGSLRRLEAGSLWATPGFLQGQLWNVKADVEGGTVLSDLAELKPDQVKWPGHLAFARNDGWNGEAAGGFAPRPLPGQAVNLVELKQFQAHRAVEGGTENLKAEGARWTPAGLRLEGSVAWDQPQGGQRLMLRAPRILLREGDGTDLPPDLARGDARAEGSALLTWGNRSLSTPRAELKRASGSWRLAAPVLGRSEEGTFSAGAGSGNPVHWSFEGPVVADLLGGGNLRGTRLDWEERPKGELPMWLLSGRPATWTRLRERLTGLRILRQGEKLIFSEGIRGTLSANEGELTLKADRGESDLAKVLLSGRVECQGLGWRLQADRIVVSLGPGRIVKNVRAEGGVLLRGRMGEGHGAALDLDMASQVARWQGRVRGLAETEAF